jgi:MFS transporter, MCT family, solute carrier family 16 (monocarboxylic acid transporters), member 10
MSLVSSPIMAMGGTQDMGRRLGTAFTVFAFGALAGLPICGAINTATGGFKATGYFAGTLFYFYFSFVHYFSLTRLPL